MPIPFRASPRRPPLDLLAERRRRGRPTPPDSMDDRHRHERVAREALHQELIEATLERAEAHERLGDFERALEWLDRAASLSGDLPPAYRARRARWLRAESRRRGPAAGSWRDGSAGWERMRRGR